MWWKPTAMPDSQTASPQAPRRAGAFPTPVNWIYNLFFWSKVVQGREPAERGVPICPSDASGQVSAAMEIGLAM